MSETAPQHDEFAVHQEEDLVATRTLVTTGVVGVIIGAAGVLVAGALVVAGVGALRPSLAGEGGPRPAGPEISNVEQTPVRDARRGLDLRAQQERELEKWGWVDRDAGIAALPIDTAIDLVVSEGAK